MRTGAAGEVSLDIPSNWGGLIIGLKDDVKLIGGPSLAAPEACAFTSSKPCQLELTTGESGSRLALIAGARLQQPIHQNGPLILASPEALEERSAAYRRGDFGHVSSQP